MPTELRKPELLPEVQHIVAVSSGKGGVGKTTVSVNLSIALKTLADAVGLLDADIYGPNVPTMMGIKEQPTSEAGKIIPLRNYGVKLMSLGFIANEDAPVIWRGPIVGKMIQQFITDVKWGRLDYLIVDLPPGTGDAQLTIAQTVPLTGAVIVTTPQDVALEDVHRSMEMFRRVDVPILGIVENMSHFCCPHCGDRAAIFGEAGGRRLADLFDVPLLGQIPVIPSICEGGDRGEPIANSDDDEAETFRRVARGVARQASRLPGSGPKINIS